MTFSPSSNGFYGSFGGQFMPELLMGPVLELQDHWEKFKFDQDIQNDLKQCLTSYAGRPTPLTVAPRFSQTIGGPRVFLKREDLLHTGAHKLNNSVGQCYLAKRMGKKRIIAETGAGQHGVATATVFARLGLQCTVYMGALDTQRQALNVKKMKFLGATVVSVAWGSGTLKDAINEALRDWSSSYEKSHYCLGSALGPHPYPEMVKTFQLVIGEEILHELKRRNEKMPNLMIACVGGGSNALGMFTPFVQQRDVELIGVEAGGVGPAVSEHAARFQGGKKGVLHGCYTYLLQDSRGQISATHSISAGLDYPAVSPEHSYLRDAGRVRYVSVSDSEALDAFHLLAKTEGILPALESSHALAYLVKIGGSLRKDQLVIVNLSGRGEKDLPTVIERQEIS